MPPLHSKDGIPTNAVYGFTNMLLKLIFEHKPKYIAIAFDKKEPTFRHKIYKDYKANRPLPPADLIPQFDLIQDVVKSFCIKSFSISGFEADDIIGTLVKKALFKKKEVVIVSGDKDLMQLIKDDVWLLDELRAQKNGQEIYYGEKEVKETLGIMPFQVVDMLSLMGDNSDNIPGIPGIGPKTAINLINEFENLEKILDCAPLIKQKSVKEKVVAFGHLATLSKSLATIDTNVPLDCEIDDLQFFGIDKEKTLDLFLKLDFKRLIKDERLKLSFDDKPKTSINLDNIKAIKDDTECLKALENIKTQNIFGLSFFENNIIIASKEDVIFILEINQKTIYIINKFLEDKKNYFINHDAKKIYKYFELNNLTNIKISSDPMIANYLLYQDNEKHDLLTLCKKYFHIDIVSKSGPEEALYAFRLDEILKSELKKENLEKLYLECEMPLEPVLAKMESVGIKIDKDALKKLSEELKFRLNNLQDEAYKLAGEVFNLNSPKQVSEILFNKLKLGMVKKTKTGASTDAIVLEKLAHVHELPKILLEHRQLAKLLNTYIEILPSLINEKTGRIHTTFNQCVTATGRLSSKDPNLQNIPIKTLEGKKIRKAFIADENKVLISLDYSQVELRLLAYVSKDKVLVDSFEKDQDVHQRTASEIFEIEAIKVKKEQRSIAKTINFGLLYGMGAQKLSATLNISLKDAKNYLEKYFKKYSGVLAWKEKVLDEAKKNKEVRTIFGRKRSLPNIISSNQMLKSQAERLAINTPIQGTAADIIKKAMIKTNDFLSENFKSAHLLLQVHDELIIEAKAEDAEKIAQEVAEIMSNCHGLDLYLKVDFGIAKNWEEAH